LKHFAQLFIKRPKALMWSVTAALALWSFDSRAEAPTWQVAVHHNQVALTHPYNSEAPFRASSVEACDADNARLNGREYEGLPWPTYYSGTGWDIAGITCALNLHFADGSSGGAPGYPYRGEWRCADHTPPVNWVCNSNLTIVLLGLATIQPGNSIPLQAKVTDSNGQPYAGAIVHLRVDAVPHSGGHIHGDDSDVKRRGNLDGIGPEAIATSPTGADGIFNFTFNGPGVSGTLNFTAWCDNRTCTQQGPNTIDVKIEGLEPLPASPGLYGLIGSYPDGNNSPHPDNHYLTPVAIKNARALAWIYKSTFPGAPLLQYNDASLKWGGVFDINGTWSGDHIEHRRGTVIDVRANRDPLTAIPVENYAWFEKMVKVNGGNPLYHPPPDAQHPRRKEHFHVRLMDRSE
jgi:hypothetical protein